MWSRFRILGLGAGLLAWVSFSPLVFAQDAEETTQAAEEVAEAVADEAAPVGFSDEVRALVERYLEVTGGVDAHRAVTSRKSSGTFSVSDEHSTVSAQLTVYNEPPNFLMVFDAGELGEVKTGVTNGTAWQSHYMYGDAILEGEEAEALYERANLKPWGHWEEVFDGGAVLREEEHDGEMLVIAEFFIEGHESIYAAFSKETGLIVAERLLGFGGNRVIWDWSDYRDVGGLLEPHALKVGDNITYVVSEMQHNSDIPDDVFEIPESVLQVSE